jgi:hypothetical protein
METAGGLDVPRDLRKHANPQVSAGLTVPGRTRRVGQSAHADRRGRTDSKAVDVLGSITSSAGRD